MTGGPGVGAREGVMDGDRANFERCCGDKKATGRPLPAPQLGATGLADEWAHAPAEGFIKFYATRERARAVKREHSRACGGAGVPVPRASPVGGNLDATARVWSPPCCYCAK